MKKNLANLITIIGLFLGVFSLFMLLNGKLFPAFLLLISAIFCDLLDGFVARKYSCETPAGKWLDTCTDIVIYLIFPMFFWSERISYLVTIVVICTGLFRLIRFSLSGLEGKDDKLYYLGMPVFYLQTLLAFDLVLDFPSFFLSALLLVMSVLMVTKIKFRKPGVKFFIGTLAIYLVIVIWRFYGS